MSQTSTSALPWEITARAVDIISETWGSEDAEACLPTGRENVKLMGEVLAYADWEVARAKRERDSSRFDMRFWISGTVKKTEENTPPPMPCGTSACLAGTATAFTMGMDEIMVDDRVGPVVSIEVTDWEKWDDGAKDSAVPTKTVEAVDGNKGESVETRGREKLGLSFDQSHILFRTYNYGLPDIKIVASYMTGVDLTGDLSALLPKFEEATA